MSVTHGRFRAVYKRLMLIDGWWDVHAASGGVPSAVNSRVVHSDCSETGCDNFIQMSNSFKHTQLRPIYSQHRSLFKELIIFSLYFNAQTHILGLSKWPGFTVAISTVKLS